MWGVSILLTQGPLTDNYNHINHGIFIMVSVLVFSTVYYGSSRSPIKLKTIKLVFAVSHSSTQYQRVGSLPAL